MAVMGLRKAQLPAVWLGAREDTGKGGNSSIKKINGPRSSRLRKIPLLSVQVAVNPGPLRAFDGLGHLVRLLPVSMGVVPQSHDELRQAGGRRTLGE